MKQFFAGALVAAPVTAVCMLLVLNWQGQVDARVERAELRSRLAHAEGQADFDAKWDAMQKGLGKDTRPAATDTVEVAALKSRLASLETELAYSKARQVHSVQELNSLVNGNNMEAVPHVQ